MTIKKCDRCGKEFGPDKNGTNVVDFDIRRPANSQYTSTAHLLDLCNDCTFNLEQIVIGYINEN